jgi:uncharacterized membrane protein
MMALLAVGLAIVGQRHIARHEYVLDGVFYLLLGTVLFLTASARPQDSTVVMWPHNGGVLPDDERVPLASPRTRKALVGLVIVLSAVAFLSLPDNRFTLRGVLCWGAAVLVWLLAAARVSRGRRLWRVASRLGLHRTLRQGGVAVRGSWVSLLLVGVLIVALFFRTHRIDSLPPEAQSDHVEASEDVRSILNGHHMIFFPRNTGREATQFYVTAGLSHIFGYGFFTLKLTMALIGALNVIPMYLLGKELWDGRFGLLAAFFLAISYWHVIISRIGWRIALAPFWTAATLYSLLRAFRTGRRNDYLISGLSLGMGLYGYMSFRVTPLLVVALCLLKVLFDREPGFRWRRYVGNVGHLVVTSVLVFLPMVRYMYDEPRMYWYRVLTRTTDLERAVEHSTLSIFLDNVKRALLMFNWVGDGAWVQSVAGSPALDRVSGALFVLGGVYVLYLLMVKRRPLALYLLVSIFIVLLPSTLSIAFPVENPSNLRASGVIPLMAVLVAFPVYLVGRQVARDLWGGAGKILAIGLGGVLLYQAAGLNYEKYFVHYDRGYRRAAWNASDMASVIRGFGESIGSIHDVYYVAIPHWVDHRAVALMLGDMEWNNLIVDINEAASHVDQARNRLYIYHPTDTATERWLHQHYPHGQLMRFEAFIPEKDFMIYLAPARR